MGLNLSDGWDMELQHSYTAGRCDSKYNHLGNLAVSTEDEHTHTHQPAVSFLWIDPTEMQTHVYQTTCRTFSRFIYQSRQTETTQMSTNRKERQNVVYLYNEIL